MRTRVRRLVFALSLVAAACTPPQPGSPGVVREADTTGLVEVTNYGDTYDGLKMWKHVPAGMPENAPLVLALHPCGYTSPLTAYATDSGWNQMADKYKFYVVYAEQQSANNQLFCFNWAGDKTDSNGVNQPTNLERGMGENNAMMNMIKKMEADYSIDSKRIFVTGFSGGGAQTALMLSLWPDVFAGGAVMEGVPYHCTLNKNEVSNPCMSPGKNQTGQQWGDLVRMALPSGYAGPWPRLQVWEGSMDTFVGTDNLSELVKQFTNISGISDTPTMKDQISGNDHAVYSDGHGGTQIETFMMNGMSHAQSIDSKNGCGTSDFNYYADKGLCAADYAAKFFGLQNPAAAGDGGVVGGGSDAGVVGGSDGGGGGTGGSGGGGGSGAPTDMAWGDPWSHPPDLAGGGGTHVVTGCSCDIAAPAPIARGTWLVLLAIGGFVWRRNRRRA